MTELRTVRVAAAQATPVILDAPASIAKAVELVERAAADGAELVVLPETFVPLYPSQAWAKSNDPARSTTRLSCSAPRASSGSTAS